MLTMATVNKIHNICVFNALRIQLSHPAWRRRTAFQLLLQQTTPMKIQFWSIGKAHESHVIEGILMYNKRIQNYFPIQWQIIPTPKNSGALSTSELKKKESEQILKILQKDDYLVVLDEKGKQFPSEGIASMIQQCANASHKNMIFLIGGAYGIDDSIKDRANLIWGLSLLVFPHQLVRLILAEQIYRACTIIRNENYHHS